MDEHEPINGYFGLSYSNYLVLHRTIMQNMPLEWQLKFVRLIEEMEGRCKSLDMPDSFIIQAATEHEVSSLSEPQMKKLNVSCEFGEEASKYYVGAEEVPSWHRVLVPCDDPIPHYRDRKFTLSV